MEYNSMRSNLWDMMDALTKAGYTIKNLYNTDNQDKTTTLFESVQGLFDDVFEKEIEAEIAERNAEQDRADDDFEKRWDVL